jgi:hypothetical protein
MLISKLGDGRVALRYQKALICQDADIQWTIGGLGVGWQK